MRGQSGGEGCHSPLLIKGTGGREEEREGEGGKEGEKLSNIRGREVCLHTLNTLRSIGVGSVKTAEMH